MKRAILILIFGALLLTQWAAWASGANVTEGLKPGIDITEAVKEAIKSGDYNIEIGPGTWKLGTITLPDKSGWRFVGVGSVSGSANSYWTGYGTKLEYSGEGRADVWITAAGSHSEFGNLTLDGKGKVDIGVRFRRPKDSGIGTGKCQVRRLVVYDMKTGVMLGDGVNALSCDCIDFEHLEGDKCDTVFYSLTEQAMGNVIHRFIARDCKTPIVLKGGDLRLENPLCVKPYTLITVPPGPHGFGLGNGNIVIVHPEIDAQCENEFTLIDCQCHAHLRFSVYDGKHAIWQSNGKPVVYTGTFAKLTGSNRLDIYGMTSTFGRIEAKKSPGWGEPVVTINNSMIHGNADPRKIFEGDGVFRVINCSRPDGKMIDWTNEVITPEVIPDYSEEIQRLDERINGLKLVVPE